jgi:hypothetical protein
MDSSLIRKLTMENLRMSKEMFSIAIKYALAKEATFNTREQKEKESGHTDQPGSSKGHDKKRKADHSVNTMERLQHHKEYWPRLGDFEGFASASSNPKESTRSRTATDSKVLQMRFSRRPEVPIKRKSLRNPTMTSPKPIRGSTTSMVAPIYMSQGGSRNSQTGRSWWSLLPPQSTLDGLRSPLPSTVVTTQSLCQSWGGILSSSAPSSRMLSSTKSSSMEEAP